ncbi:MAG: PAS domain S-box protein [Chloroflexota bacterium]
MPPSGGGVQARGRALEPYRLLFERARDIILFVMLDGRIVDANEAAVAAYGYSLPELLSMTIQQLRSPETTGRVKEQMSRADRDGILFETVHRRKDGSSFPVEVSSQGATIGTERLILSIIRDITERKRTEDALRRSEEMLAGSQRLAQMGSFEFEVPGEEAQWSAEAFLLLGRDPSEGAPSLEEYVERYVHPDDRQPLRDSVRQIVSRRKPFDFQYRVVLAGGQVKHIQSVGRPLVNSDGVVVGIVGTVLDITQRKQSEDALRRSEENFRRSFEQSPIGMAIVSLDYRFQRVNQALSRILGYSAKELTSLSFTDITHPDDVRPSLELAERLASGEVDQYQMDKRYIRKDGRVVWVQLTTSMMRDAVGHPLYYLSMMEDIGERKRADEEQRRLLSEVQQRAAELDATIESIPDGVLIYGVKGEILRMNSAAERMMGYSAAERELSMAERLLLLRMETADGKPVSVEESAPWRAVRGETVRGAVLLLHSRGARPIWISTSAAPICNLEGELVGAVMITTDITALHDLQEQRAKYILGISHGLRTPLTVVQGQAQLLMRALERVGPEGGMRHSAEAVVTSAQRMGVMLRDLVDLMYLESGQPLMLNREAIDLVAFLIDLKERLAGFLETARIRVHFPDGLPRVMADPDRLERILMNLLSNALKYSEPNTEVTVTLRRLDAEVVTEVSDRGPGIPPERLPHLFEPYQRSQMVMERRETVGLGLHVAKGLVVAQGGWIWVESEVGKGSTFSFTLPVA